MLGLVALGLFAALEALEVSPVFLLLSNGLLIRPCQRALQLSGLFETRAALKTVLHCERPFLIFIMSLFLSSGF